jgi:hypothetical protein
MIDISTLSKAAVLAALYNGSKPQGRGREVTVSGDMTEEEAESLLRHTTYFDYLKGRVMKINLEGDTLDPYLYDRDNGAGAAAQAIAKLK